MHPGQRVVTQLPVDELWNETGRVAATRGRPVTSEDVREMLHAGPVQFVVACVGEPLRWIEPRESYRFWKDEVRLHLCDEPRGRLEDYPSGYFYWASVWSLDDGRSVIVVEVAH